MLGALACATWRMDDMAELVAVLLISGGTFALGWVYVVLRKRQTAYPAPRGARSLGSWGKLAWRSGMKFCGQEERSFWCNVVANNLTDVYSPCSQEEIDEHLAFAVALADGALLAFRKRDGSKP